MNDVDGLHSLLLDGDASPDDQDNHGFTLMHVGHLSSKPSVSPIPSDAF
jgi:hypothetical protein